MLAGNQPGFAKGLSNSGVPREEVFVCGSVVSNRARGFKAAYRATKRGLDANMVAFATGGLTYVDMMMLDYPGASSYSSSYIYIYYILHIFYKRRDHTTTRPQIQQQQHTSNNRKDITRRTLGSRRKCHM